MKIKVTEIEATAEDLRVNRTVGEELTDMFRRIGETIAPNVRLRIEEEEKTEDGE